MARHKVTFTVNSPGCIFDAVQKAGSHALGDRLIGILMTGEVGFADAIALDAVYNISVDTEKLED